MTNYIKEIISVTAELLLTAFALYGAWSYGITSEGFTNYQEVCQHTCLEYFNDTQFDGHIWTVEIVSSPISCYCIPRSLFTKNKTRDREALKNFTLNYYVEGLENGNN